MIIVPLVKCLPSFLTPILCSYAPFQRLHAGKVQSQVKSSHIRTGPHEIARHRGDLRYSKIGWIWRGSFPLPVYINSSTPRSDSVCVLAYDFTLCRRGSQSAGERRPAKRLKRNEHRNPGLSGCLDLQYITRKQYLYKSTMMLMVLESFNKR